MKLKQLKLTNFRCYGPETAIDLDELVVFVGKNDAGKSTIFEALEIFFENKSSPDSDDVTVGAENSKVRITCVFGEAPEELVIDAQRPTDLASEYLLNAQGLLEITKVYDCGLARPKLSGVFAQALHPTADGYHELLTLTNTRLKQQAASLGVQLDGINQSVNTELRRAIWSHAEDLELQEMEVELKTEAAKKIWDQLKKFLPIFALFKSDRPSTDQDAEAQDPMKAAVKEAIRAQEDTFNEITESVKSEVQKIANRTVAKIQEMNPELAKELTPRVSTRNWDTLFSVNLTGDENIPINKRGSGTRRLVLLNFFRAKVEQDAEGSDSGLIYAIEEPETSQHPHHQVILVRALEELVESSDCQVFISTHTPVLARRFNQDALRLVSKNGDNPSIRRGSEEETLKEIVDSLGVLPDHNVKVFFCVEGRNDMNFLSAVSKMLQESGESDIPELEEEEKSGRLVIVPLGGSSLDLWVSRLREFNRPEIYLMDRDDPDRPKYQNIAQKISNLENCTSFITGKKELENYIHPDVIKEALPFYEGVGDAFEDVPQLFAKAVHESSESDVEWEQLTLEKKAKKESRGKSRLNTEYASKMTPELLSRIDADDEVRQWLRAIGSALADASV